MIKVTFNKPERIEDKVNFRSKRQVCINELNRNSKVWFFEVEKGIYYFNYNNSQIIKSIEKVKGWI